MQMLVGLLSKQIMRHAALSPAAGKKKYSAIFSSDQYHDVKKDVDQLLIKCGYSYLVK